MTKFLFHRSKACRPALAFSFIFAWALSIHAQTVTWQALPFPIDNDWPGPQGQPATISSNQVVLQGQPVRALQSFSFPFTINLDVQLASRYAPDGNFDLYLIPTGWPTNTMPHPALELYVGYRNPGDYSGVDDVEIHEQTGPTTATNLWTSVPINLVAGTLYHLTFQVSDAGTLGLVFNGTAYTIPSDIAYTISPCQIEMWGWQPTDTWTVTNFGIVPEPSTMALVGVSLVWVAVFIRRRSRSVLPW